MKTYRSIKSLSLGLLAFAFAITIGLTAHFLPLVWPAIVSAQSRLTHATKLPSVTLIFTESGGSGAIVNGGKTRLLRRGAIATRDDGTFVEISEILGKTGKVVSSFRQIELPSGVRIDVDDTSRVIVAVKRSTLPAAAIGPRDKIGSGCEQRSPVANADLRFTSLGQEDIAGQSTFGYRTEGPSFVMMSWRSQAIGCEELKRVMFFKDRSGEITDWTERVVERVIPGQPDAALFHISASYARVSYAEKYRREVLRLGEVPDAKELENLQRIDERSKDARYDGPLP